MAFGALRGRRLRAHRRLHRRIVALGVDWIRGEHAFRMVERLHRAGLVTACVSRPSWSSGRRPFRELAVFANEAVARTKYREVLPR